MGQIVGREKIEETKLVYGGETPQGRWGEKGEWEERD